MLNTLFVYGTLRKARNGELHPYLKQHAVFVGQAHLPGKLYQIDHYPGAIQVAAFSKLRIQGEVYRLSQPQTTLAVLDEYEECTPHFPMPHEYRRQAETVILANGTALNAWVYWFERPVCGLKPIDSGDYYPYLPAHHTEAL